MAPVLSDQHRMSPLQARQICTSPSANISYRSIGRLTCTLASAKMFSGSLTRLVLMCLVFTLHSTKLSVFYSKLWSQLLCTTLSFTPMERRKWVWRKLGRRRIVWSALNWIEKNITKYDEGLCVVDMTKHYECNTSSNCTILNQKESINFATPPIGNKIIPKTIKVRLCHWTPLQVTKPKLNLCSVITLIIPETFERKSADYVCLERDPVVLVTT